MPNLPFVPLISHFSDCHQSLEKLKRVRTLRYVQSNHQQNEKCNLFCTNCCFLKVILTSAGFLLRSICSAQTCAWMKRYWKRMMLLSSLKVVERHLSHSFILTGLFYVSTKLFNFGRCSGVLGWNNHLLYFSHTFYAARVIFKD